MRILGALVLGGVIACTSIAGAADRNGDRKGKASEIIQQRVDSLQKDLSLTAEQKTKVKALIENEVKEMRSMREEGQNLSAEQRREKMMERRKAMDAKMKEILKPEQYEKWVKVRQQRPGRPGADGDDAQKKGERKGKKKNG